MNNLSWGIVTLLCASLGYGVSWRFHRHGHYARAILLLILSGLALYVYVSADFFLHAWDERYHALVAKNLMNHPLRPTLYEHPVLPYDYRNWAANHIWLHKQPLPLWGMAASMWLFGVNEMALRLPSIILASTATFLVFSVGSYLFDRRIGYFAAFLFSINGLVISLVGGRTATDHVDIFFMFFILLSIYLSIQFITYEKSVFSILVGISIGLAILSKWLPALIVLPVWLLLVWDCRKFTVKTMAAQFVLIVLVLTAVFLPWQIYIHAVFPEEALAESRHNIRHLFEALDGHSTTVFYFLNRIRVNYGELIYLPLGWFAWKYCRNFKNGKRLALIIWFLVPFLFFSMARTRMQAYLLFTAPALFYMTAECFYDMAEYRSGHRFKHLLTVILSLFIILPVRYGIERLTILEIKDRHPQWVRDLQNLQEKNIANGVLFNYNHPIEAMFYTDLTAYPQIPDRQTISDLIRRGYTVVINDLGTVPAEIMEMEEVVRVELTGAD
ncbi:MAG: glycosyltransferase family 39 protein [Desulfofustis sp.]|nr:glycosyltransferase family 39 protein [Desulfofustis sp.]